MWSDTLLAAERGHLLRLLVWGAASVMAGTAVIALASVRRPRSPLLWHFGLQTSVWGAVDLALVAASWGRLHERDLLGAARLLNFLWLNVGLDVGYIAVGVTLVIAGWVLARRLGAVGAGIGVVVQGTALLVLDARLIGIIAASFPS